MACKLPAFLITFKSSRSIGYVNPVSSRFKCINCLFLRINFEIQSISVACCSFKPLERSMTALFSELSSSSAMLSSPPKFPKLILLYTCVTRLLWLRFRKRSDLLFFNTSSMTRNWIAVTRESRISSSSSWHLRR